MSCSRHSPRRTHGLASRKVISNLQNRVLPAAAAAAGPGVAATLGGAAPRGAGLGAAYGNFGWVLLSRSSSSRSSSWHEPQGRWCAR